MKDEFKIDFLCVGFQKCATSTLDAILRQHSKVALPDIKEIHLEEWAYRCKDPIQVIKHKYFQKDYNDKTIGIIDPNLRDCVRVINKHMGKDIKLIFMLRNPVDRLFSYYKMALSLGFYGVYPSTLYGKQITDVRRSFGRYVKSELRREVKNPPILWGNYVDVIRKFSRYYDKEQMYFVVFEDFIINQEKSVRELCRFLSLPYEKLDCNVWAYSGNMISKNDICFKINSRIVSVREAVRCHPRSTVQQFDMIDGIFNRVSKYTTEINKEHMDEKTRKQLESYYRESIRRLEEFLDIDLSQKWF